MIAVELAGWNDTPALEVARVLSATPGVRVNRLNIYLPLRLTGEYVLDLVGPWALLLDKSAN